MEATTLLGALTAEMGLAGPSRGPRGAAPDAAAIAREELLHAERAWAVDAWGGARLDPARRARLREAHHEALHELERELAQHPPPESLVREAGLPSREQALAMLPGLAGLLTAAA